MKLIYRVTLRLSIVLLPILLVWAAVFYYSMVDEINDETDDNLEDYATMLIRRALTGSELPGPNEGSNNTYSIELLSNDKEHSKFLKFEDRNIYIPEKRETEPARILTMTFTDSNSNTYLLTVSTPTFEREDLLLSVFWHLVALYAILIITILSVTTLIFNYSMRPLYRLLYWLDGYNLGNGVENLPVCTHITEFKKLTESARSTIERAEKYYERQKQFIGNASHELQTPLAVCQNRIEMMMNDDTLSEQQMMELAKIEQTISELIRLNKTLLFLSKIENNQYIEQTDVDINSKIRRQMEMLAEVYESKNITTHLYDKGQWRLTANDELMASLVSNLLRNAYIHSLPHSTIDIYIKEGALSIANTGDNDTLDTSRLFDRFYCGNPGKQHSNGLGLSIVKAICEVSNLKVGYSFEQGKHIFTINQ